MEEGGKKPERRSRSFSIMLYFFEAEAGEGAERRERAADPRRLELSLRRFLRKSRMTRGKKERRGKG